MIHGNSGTTVSLHDVTAADLDVKVRIETGSISNWAQIKIENYDLTMFAVTRSEAVAILTKLRDTIDVAIAAEVELVA